MRADNALRPRFEKALSIFTIHNLAFQGIGKREDFALLNIGAPYFSVDYLEFYGHLNLMKGAIVLCDGASTVSPSYAHEVTTDPELGFGLEGVLRDKGEDFVESSTAPTTMSGIPPPTAPSPRLTRPRNPTASVHARARCAIHSVCRTASIGRWSGWSPA